MFDDYLEKCIDNGCRRTLTTLVDGNIHIVDGMPIGDSANTFFKGYENHHPLVTLYISRQTRPPPSASAHNESLATYQQTSVIRHIHSANYPHVPTPQQLPSITARRVATIDADQGRVYVAQ